MFTTLLKQRGHLLCNIFYVIEPLFCCFFGSDENRRRCWRVYAAWNAPPSFLCNCFIHFHILPRNQSKKNALSLSYRYHQLNTPIQPQPLTFYIFVTSNRIRNSLISPHPFLAFRPTGKNVVDITASIQYPNYLGNLLSHRIKNNIWPCDYGSQSLSQFVSRSPDQRKILNHMHGCIDVPDDIVCGVSPRHLTVVFPNVSKIISRFWRPNSGPLTPHIARSVL